VTQIDDLQAEIMKTLAHPRRLQILHRLSKGPTSVAILADALGMNQPNASQHLAVMRAAGVVDAVRVGREVCYRLTDPDVVVACALMRRVLERRIARLAGLAAPAPAHLAPPATSPR
jgi:ArsR family transcriptional regulator